MQIQHVFVFMGLLTLACRQPDRRSQVGSTAVAATNIPTQDQRSPQATARRPTAPEPPGKPDREATAEANGSPLRNAPSETDATHKSACVVPMPENPLPQATAAARCPAAPEPTGKLDRGQIRFDDAPSRPTIEVEVARTDESRQRGLMYRKKLASESGMLFVWDDESFRAFWMRNTCIPLDMLFISNDKTIVGVQEQVPVLNEEPRGVPCPAAYVLEVNAGWVRGHKVAPGQHLTISIP